MAQAEKDDRTHAPSARRLAKAREDGNVAVSRELQSFAALVVAIVVLMTVDPSAVQRVLPRMRGYMERSAAIEIGGGSLWPIWIEMGRAAVAIAGPVLLAAWGAIVAITVLQTGPLFRLQALAPRVSRINPLSGLGRVFSGQTLVETGKSIVKLAAFGFAAWHVLAGLVPVLLRAGDVPAAALASRMIGLTVHAALIVVAVQAVVALLDLFWVRYRHQSSLRMSGQEVRDEYRESEGDPHVKARIRQLRRQRATKRMMQAVSKATVVVTNPTHYAIALSYDSTTKAAPKVVAKGMDELAARIRAVAQDSKVPLVSNPPLARALYAVPLDQEIPREHFQVVAGIIAYVWRLRRPPAAGPPVR